MNTTPRGERTHIALFGRRNVGKSSLINALTGQAISIVSEVKGTTTDPVYKAMELLPLGPVTLIDTPGLDDEGTLGAKRVQRTLEVAHKTDVALLVLEACEALAECEQVMAREILAKKTPLLVAINKCDVRQPSQEFLQEIVKVTHCAVHLISCDTGYGVEELKLALARVVPDDTAERQLVSDLLQPADLVVLVTPIDDAAPKGRLILPQQQVIRDILDAGACALVTQVAALPNTLAALGTTPRLVITDSQAFKQVAEIVPLAVPLTSFSILFARYKGDLVELVKGVRTVEKLKDGDRILIAESCTHHRQSDDIGTVKIPRWLREVTGRQLVFEHAAGMTYPHDLASFALVVHCGACMLNRREMHWRIHQACVAGVPVVNYGILIAYMQGILKRCLQAFEKSVQ